MQHGEATLRRRFWRPTAATIGVCALVAAPSAAGAVDGIDQVPAPVGREAVYLPWVADGDLGITIDGNLDDWAEVPAIVSTDGPTPSADPATTGELTWSVAAQGSRLFVSATITDASIIAGQHEENYWNEDSIEVFLNATDAIDTTTYGPGIGQVRFSAVDIGNTDPTTLTLSGTNVDTFDVEGFVFATPDGWGLEGVIDFSEWIEPAHGLSLGFQVHANGATTADRDLKVIWSDTDPDDRSFDDPSVFGTGVLFELGQTDVPAPSARSGASATTTETTDTTEAPTTTTPTTEAPTTAPPTTDAATGDADTTEDTAVLDPPSSNADSWTQSPLLFLIPLAIGLASLTGYVMSRRRAVEDDEPYDDVAPPL
ncbi:MAG: sugar-binding protein [Acidimicrobiales bacterium]